MQIEDINHNVCRLNLNPTDKLSTKCFGLSRLYTNKSGNTEYDYMINSTTETTITLPHSVMYSETISNKIICSKDIILPPTDNQEDDTIIIDFCKIPVTGSKTRNNTRTTHAYYLNGIHFPTNSDMVDYMFLTSPVFLEYLCGSIKEELNTETVIDVPQYPSLITNIKHIKFKIIKIREAEMMCEKDSHTYFRPPELIIEKSIVKTGQTKTVNLNILDSPYNLNINRAEVLYNYLKKYFRNVKNYNDSTDTRMLMDIAFRQDAVLSNLDINKDNLIVNTPFQNLVNSKLYIYRELNLLATLGGLVDTSIEEDILYYSLDPNGILINLVVTDKFPYKSPTEILNIRLQEIGLQDFNKRFGKIFNYIQPKLIKVGNKTYIYSKFSNYKEITGDFSAIIRNITELNVLPELVNDVSIITKESEVYV